MRPLFDRINWVAVLMGVSPKQKSARYNVVTASRVPLNTKYSINFDIWRLIKINKKTKILES